MKKFLVSLSCLLLILGVALPISGHAAMSQEPVDPVVDDSFTPIQSTDSFDQTLSLAETFGPYLKVDSSGLIYINSTSQQVGVTEEQYQSFLQGIQLENDYITQGKLVAQTDQSGNLQTVVGTQALNDSVQSGMQEARYSQPRYFSNVSAGFHWWGFGLKLNERETTRLLKVLGTASAAGWVAAELSAAGYITLPASVPAGLIAAILALSGAVIYMVDNGYGVTIGETWWGSRMLYAN
jgi:hypothetical protein